MVVGDGLLTFVWLSIGNGIIDDSVELGLIQLSKVGKIVLILISSLNLRVDISLKVLLFELLPSVSEFLDGSEGEESLLLGVCAVSAHGVEADDVLDLAGDERLGFDLLPFFDLRNEFLIFIEGSLFGFFLLGFPIGLFLGLSSLLNLDVQEIGESGIECLD